MGFFRVLKESLNNTKSGVFFPQIGHREPMMAIGFRAQLKSGRTSALRLSQRLQRAQFMQIGLQRETIFVTACLITLA
jgi:hypothetical protein